MTDFWLEEANRMRAESFGRAESSEETIEFLNRVKMTAQEWVQMMTSNIAAVEADENYRKPPPEFEHEWQKIKWTAPPPATFEVDDSVDDV